MEWECIAQQFNKQWNLHNCIGAMDGKHIMIRPPANSGSFYYNYKHRFSIVLLAVVDADYKFIYVDIGCNGRISDGGVFRECSLTKALEEKSLNIPAPSPLPGRSDPIPYMMVADEAFPLKEYIMKPYRRNLTRENRIFNYRLSRARRIVESAFGILANRFRAIPFPIALDPDKVELIVMACCSLHNFLKEETRYKRTGSDRFRPENWPNLRPNMAYMYWGMRAYRMQAISIIIDNSAKLVHI